MVDDMTPNDIYATIQVTPRPGTTVPQCADDLLEEVGNEEIFRRILAVGYMAWQKFEANRTKKKPTPYKPSTIRDVEEKFKVSKSLHPRPSEGGGHHQRTNKIEENPEGREERRT